MRLEFPQSMPVSAMVEMAKIYWNYPNVPRANLTLYLNGKVSVFNLAGYLKRMQDTNADKRMMTQGMSLECDNEEVGMYLMLKYF